MKGFRQVFTFTFRQLVRVKSYRLPTLILALLFFLIPAVVLPLTQTGTEEEDVIYADETETWDEENDTDAAAVSPAFIACVADDNVTVDWKTLLSTGLKGYKKAEWESYDDVQSAEKACSGKASLILVMTAPEEDWMTHISVIAPEKSLCSGTDSEKLMEAVMSQYDEVLLQNLTKEQKKALNNIAEDSEEWVEEEVTDNGAEVTDEEEDEDSEDLGTFIMSLVLPYINILLIYFLVLYYGQNTATCVILEKTSKLMDTMLVSVKPEVMILGKVTAVWAASALQFMTWLVCLGCGLGTGTFVSLKIDPASDSNAVLILKILGSGLASFGALRLLLAVVLVLAGYFMYCSLSSIGGALAGKQEDLSATNTLFSMVLIVSFMATMYSGIMNSMDTGISWVDLVPSTAVLITPARLIIGSIPVYAGLLSLLITLVFSVLVTLLAGRLYAMMSMYKGSLPKPKQLLSMLRDQKQGPEQD